MKTVPQSDYRLALRKDCLGKDAGCVYGLWQDLSLLAAREIVEKVKRLWIEDQAAFYPLR